MTVCHVTGHEPVASLGNDEADTLDKVTGWKWSLLACKEQKSTSGYTVASYMLDRRSRGLL